MYATNAKSSGLALHSWDCWAEGCFRSLICTFISLTDFPALTSWFCASSAIENHHKVRYIAPAKRETNIYTDHKMIQWLRRHFVKIKSRLVKLYMKYIILSTVRRRHTTNRAKQVLALASAALFAGLVNITGLHNYALDQSWDVVVVAWVSAQFLNGTSAHLRLYSAIIVLSLMDRIKNNERNHCKKR